MKLSSIQYDLSVLHSIKKNYSQFTGQHLLKETMSTLLNMDNEFFSDISTKFNQLDDTLIKIIDDKIQHLQSKAQSISTEYLEKHRHHFYHVYIESNLVVRKWHLNPTVKKVIVNKLQMHSNWIFPGLIFRPTSLDSIRSMVACDPLYIVDTTEFLLEHAKMEFPDSYQRRLRPYVIDQTKDNFLSHLPQDNFGFITSLDLLKYRNIQQIEIYLKEIFKLLRPGGIFSFSFNDCDHGHETSLAESFAFSFVPGNMLRSIIQQIGFNIVLVYRDISAISWWEIQKPGNIQSIRGGQTLAKIIAKSK